MRESLTRRALLVAAASTATAVTVHYGLREVQNVFPNDLKPHDNLPPFDEKSLPDDPPMAESAIDRAIDVRPEPLYRASTVLFLGKDRTYGHGALIARDDRFYIYTVGHVGEFAAGEQTRISIPGVGSTPFQNERLLLTRKHRAEPEPAAYYVLGDNAAEYLQKKVDEEAVTPLSLTYSLPKKNETLFVPSYSTGEYSAYRFVRYDRSDNWIVAESLNGENCMGDSGSPLLQAVADSNGELFLTGGVYGALQVAFDPAFDISAINICSPQIGVRPNN